MPKYTDTDNLRKFSDAAKLAGLDHLSANIFENLDPNGSHVVLHDSLETLKRSSGIWIKSDFLIKLDDDISMYVETCYVPMDDFLDLENEDIDETVAPV